MSSIDPNFDIQKPQSYQDLAQFSGLNETDSKTYLQSAKKWALSVATAARPSQSSVRVAKNHIEKSANEKLAEIRIGNPSDNVVDQIEFAKNALDKLRILKQNLRIHNEVISQYNKRFYFKDGVAACKTHDSLLTQIEEIEKKIQANLERHCTQYSESIINRLMEQINTGMVVDREFAKEHYPNILKKFDILPETQREAKLRDLHFLLNKAYVYFLREKLTNNFHEVIPKTMKILFKKLGLEKYFDESDISSKAVNAMAEKLSAFAKNDDIDTLTLPECIGIVHSKFLTFATTILKENRIDDHVAQGLVYSLQNLHKLELETPEKWRTVASNLTDDEIEAELQNFLKNNMYNNQLIDPEVMKKRIASIRKEFVNIVPTVYFAEIIEKNSIENLIEEKFTRDLTQDFMDAEKIKQKCLDFVRVFCGKMSKLSQEQWLERNNRYCDFQFNQSEFGSDYILGGGCCWSISFEWILRLIQLGSAPIGSYQEFIPPPHPIKVGENMDSKPTLKRFTEELEASTNRTRITPNMRRIQAQGLIELRLGGKNQDIPAQKFGRSAKKLFNQSSSFNSFIKELIHKIESDPNVKETLMSVNHTLELAGFDHEGGHSMVLQLDPENNLYRFGDPNRGMFTFLDKETFIQQMSQYMDLYYKDFNEFSVRAYPKKTQNQPLKPSE